MARYFSAFVPDLTSSTSSYRQFNIDWNKTHYKCRNLNFDNLTSHLLLFFDNYNFLQEKNVKTFHIDNNHLSHNSQEPDQTNTHNMIHNFLFYIYQRNILASLLKYFLMSSLLKKMKKLSDIASKKSCFFRCYQRLKEIIFESVLVSFNGSNYDNYLLCNDLITILNKQSQKMFMFKKGASISTILIKCKNNLKPNGYFVKRSANQKSNIRSQWPMNLFIKDIRNLFSANMSLDKIGKLFKLPVSKLVFPYDKATSVKELKITHSLHPHDDNYWKDSFQGKTVDIDSRLHAQEIFDRENFSNLYDYGTFYLIQDCLLLHSILLTVFNSYLCDNINIFLRRTYSQSSLAFQQFYILEPAKQIEKTIAPVKIDHPFYNYLVKQAITGGLCTSFVHGKVGKSSNNTINSHLKYCNLPSNQSSCWPSFQHLDKNSFNERSEGISTYDIRSLYPSAAIKPLPIGTPLFFTRVSQNHYHYLNHLMYDKKCKHLNIHEFCQYIQSNPRNYDSDYFYRLNRLPQGKSEYLALQNYLINNIPQNVQILRFQSNFTALGQLFFGHYNVDGFLSWKDNNNNIHLKIIQYHSAHYHGHRNSCPLYETSTEQSTKTENVKTNILLLWNQMKTIFGLENHSFQYVEIYDCDFYNHTIPSGPDSLLQLEKKYSYLHFLTNILNKSITGLLVVKNLEIKKTNQNPLFGFLIQKAEYGLQQMSPYTQQHISSLVNSRRVVSLQKGKNFMVINTEYFCWLHETFGFQQLPDIYHALCFRLDNYLGSIMKSRLFERKEIKSLINIETNLEKKQNLEIKAELIKLMLNSSYGFTLCNLSSEKFKRFIITRNFPKKNISQSWKSCIQIDKSSYLVEQINQQQQQSKFQTLLGHVGCYILFQSKKILLKRLYFLLKYLNPSQAQLLYMDTDSAHFLLKHNNLADNVHDTLKQEFLLQLPKHFDCGPKLSGVWVHEHDFEHAEYLGEKSYHLYNSNNEIYLTHMKGLNKKFQDQFHHEKINPSEYPAISYNNFFKSPDFILYKANISKNLFKNFIPIKRYFVSSDCSLPLKL